MKGQRQAHSGVGRGDVNARDDWRTPESVLDLARSLGHIGLDPCGNSDNSTGAAVVYSGPDGNGIDGLTERWDPGTGLVWTNPPYSEARAWATKISLEAAQLTQIISLVPARTDTSWWRTATSNATAVAFWRGRITFALPPDIETFQVEGSDGLEQISAIPGVIKVVKQKKYLYVEVKRGLAESIVDEYEVPLKPLPPSPAPFPSALLFYNLDMADIQRVFGDVVDVYVKPSWAPPKPSPESLRELVLSRLR